MIPSTEHVLPACFVSGAKSRCSRTNLGGGQTLLGGLDDELNDLLGAEVVLQPLRVLAQVASEKWDVRSEQSEHRAGRSPRYPFRECACDPWLVSEAG